MTNLSKKTLKIYTSLISLKYKCVKDFKHSLMTAQQCCELIQRILLNRHFFGAVLGLQKS